MGGAAKGARAAFADPNLAHTRVLAGDIGILALLLFAASGGLAIADIWIPTALQGWLEWGIALGVIAISALVFQFARLLEIWKSHFINSQAIPENVNFAELFLYFVASHVALATLVFLSTYPTALGENHIGLSNTDTAVADYVHVGLFLGCFFWTFIPLGVAFWLQSLRAVRARKQKLFRDDVVSRASFVIMVTLFASIGLLAWAAAGRMFEMTSDFGVLVTGLVILAFVATITAPQLARYWNNLTEERFRRAKPYVKNAAFPSVAPEKIVSRLDSALVRLVAPFSGATQTRLPPHILLFAVMVPLSALGFVLVSPYGLIPIFVGMLVVLALGRRWAWLEDDRETASRLQSTEGSEIHIGFRNDLKDEALHGYAWLFILVPLALNQLQEWTHSFREIEGATSGNSLIDWIRFFGAELAKAVPFVDWWEIYNVNVSTPFDARDAAPLAKHLTFASRAMVDLVIMAALFQALGIWQRSRTQRRLYAAGQIDYFDPFTELDFFITGIQLDDKGRRVAKNSFEKRVTEHANAREAKGKPRLPYNSERLAELLKSDNLDVREGALWMISTFGVLTGSTKQQLGQLRNRWLLFRIHQHAAANTPKSQSIIRNEKLEFERVLSDLKRDLSETRRGAIDPAAQLEDDYVGALAYLLSVVKGAPEFGYARELSYQLLALVATERAVEVLALWVLEERHLNARLEWKERLADLRFEVKTLREGKVDAHGREGRADIREQVYDALETIGLNPAAAVETRELAHQLLAWMGIQFRVGDGQTGDKAISARGRANEAAMEVANALRGAAV